MFLQHRRVSTTNKDTASEKHELFKEQLLELEKERENVFGWEDNERNDSWKNSSIQTNEKGDRIVDLLCEDEKLSDAKLTHVSQSGDSCTMVNIGPKVATKRTARARSIVLFPPEVLNAFSIFSTSNKNNMEMMGPKGPIFATAKLAGIMAAKRTADLIPLCHPLPLDWVDINILLQENKAIIHCECSVTHKTGVEMEALVGASVTALTIYDMVKAVSHRVQIQETVLEAKSGGKRQVGIDNKNKTK